MAAPQKKLELYTPEYYAYCGLGGILSCGLTHAAMTPVDLVKCRKQVRKVHRKRFFQRRAKSGKRDPAWFGLARDANGLWRAEIVVEIWRVATVR